MKETTRDRYRLIGVDASPYSAKVRAILRYRRLPFDWVVRTPTAQAEIAHVKPQLMPVIRYPDGDYRTDSTPIALDLEVRHPGVRSIVPDDSGQAFLSHLIEDMADEWVTKILFLLRFRLPLDQHYAARWVISDRRPDLVGDALEAAIEEFRRRQLSRMALVGATAANAGSIDASFACLLAILEPGIAGGRYLFGTRPALADFGLYGQLRTLVTDPTPQAIIRETAPALEHWIRRLDDASGVEGEWDAPEPVSPTVEALVRMAGEVYLPFLLANDAALREDRESFTVELPGGPLTQPPFRYQAKCLAWLREHWNRLDGEAAARTAAVLEEAGCLSAFVA